MKFKRLIFWGVFLLFTAYFFAREIKILVVDKEIEIPLEGVQITIEGEDEIFFTDEEGVALIQTESKTVNGKASLIGYSSKSFSLSAQEDSLEIALSIEDLFEGEELVVTEKSYEKTDEVSSVSVVLTKEQLETTANIGIFPDVMTSVKTLPGVTYSGAFSQSPSIRGSYPYEMAVFLDGLYIVAPFHWQGAVSIFDPAFVNSVKLSHGIYSAKFGHGTSGLLDVSSIDPKNAERKLEASISLLQTDIFAEVPLSDNFLVAAGYRGTYLDPIPWMYDTFGITKLIQWIEPSFNRNIQDFIKRMPYLHDGYFMFSYEPVSRLSISANAFYGDEGVQIKIDDKLKEEIRYDEDIIAKGGESYDKTTSYERNIVGWDDWFVFSSFNLKWLPLDFIQIKSATGFNYYKNTINIDVSSGYWGERYTSFVTEKYYFNEETGMYEVGDEYLRIEDAKSAAEDIFLLENSYNIKTYQEILSADLLLSDVSIVSFGVEEFLKQKSSYNLFEEKYYRLTDRKYPNNEGEDYFSEDYEYGKNEKIVKGNNALNSSAYVSWEFGNNSTDFQSEIGFRMEHFYLYNDEDTIKLNLFPTFNPRASARYTLFKSKGIIDEAIISGGFGLFSLLSDEMLDVNSKYEFIGEKLKPDRNLFGIFGTKFYFLDGYKFQLETYYKYYLNRFYSVADERDLNNASYKYLADGKGRIFGFDMMLSKEKQGFFDGYMTYSFIYARFKNPLKEDYVGQTTSAGEPLGIEYFPYYHRYHSLGFVLNFRPKPGLVYTLNGNFISGNPRKVEFDWNPDIYDETIYSDTARHSYSIPLSFRVGITKDFKKWTNAKYEWYFAAENILGLLNQTSIVGTFIYQKYPVDLQRIQMLDLANFDLGIPLVSVGFKVKF